MSRRPVPSPADWYRLGDGVLGLRTDNAAFRRRMRRLYGDCATGTPGTSPRLECTSRLDGPLVELALDGLEPGFDLTGFALAVFPDRGYAEDAGGPGDGSRVLAGGAAGRLVFGPTAFMAEAARPWQRFAGNLAVNLTLQQQAGTVFFHAAAVGHRTGGVLLAGPKAAGKTTLSMALAARGLQFLGDETAGVRLIDREVVPVRRTAAIRDGPAAKSVAARLRAERFPRERFPDGTVRVRASGSALFAAGRAATGGAPLRALAFLRGFAARPAVERIQPGRGQLGWLTPLACSLWGRDPARRAMELAGLLASVPCYTVILGAPDATAELLDRTLEA